MSSAVAALELAERAPLALPPADDELLLLLPPPLRPPLLLLLLALDREEGDGHLPHDLRHETSMKDGSFRGIDLTTDKGNDPDPKSIYEARRPHLPDESAIHSKTSESKHPDP